jgi:hypothetical protein
LLELGTPAFSFENGRILCYLLRRDSGSERLVAVPRIVGSLDPGHGSWKTAEYDLVVVFESDGTVGDLALAHFGEHVESLLW